MNAGRVGERIATPQTEALLRRRSNTMIEILRNMWHDDEGQDLAEYGLLLILICVAVVGVVVAFRAQIEAVFTSATTALTP